MEIASLDDTELENTRLDDAHWIHLKEEALAFNEAFVCSKLYNNLDEEKLPDDEDEEDELPHPSGGSLKEDNKELELAHKLIGLVEVEESSFKKNAIQQWTKELVSLCSTPRDSSSSFLFVLKKRLEVFQRLHKAYLRTRERTARANVSATSSASETSESRDITISGDIANTSHTNNSVPVVVRLGVLTLFPIIESLSRIPEANYSKVCGQVLDILLNVLSTLPPLALHSEPEDCLNAFEQFIYSQINSSQFIIDTEQKAQALIVLFGLAIARGNAKDVLLLIDTLFKIYKKMGEESKNNNNSNNNNVGAPLKVIL